jgi:tetratricopeptide (TPR) repeat protein
MLTKSTNHRKSATLTIFVAVLLVCNHDGPVLGQAKPGEAAAVEIRISGVEGTVQVLPFGAATWVNTQTNQVLHAQDRIRSLEKSRVTLLWSDHSVVPFGPLTEIEILPTEEPGSLAGLHLIKGILSFFHRDKPLRLKVVTRGGIAGVVGTEFVLSTGTPGDGDGSRLSVIDGVVRISNEHGDLVLGSHEKGILIPGQPPVRSPGFDAKNVLQWCFYYPAVLDLSDLKLNSAEQAALANSLSAYRSGDLVAALRSYPAGRAPGSPDEAVFYAALLLSVGEVAEAEAVLAPTSANDERIALLVGALRELVAAVKNESIGAPGEKRPALATERLAASYYAQSRNSGDKSLTEALVAAKKAAALSPGFGFAWVRVAELEFSFDRTGEALKNLNEGLELSPRNAQGLALKGFLLAGQNRINEALMWFNRALAVDAALGNAWLGRALCRIRRGDGTGGREDLLVAAALEPQRSVLRSYLGKAFADAGENKLAVKELSLARDLDQNDPTTWLYSALLKQQQNLINPAIEDLQIAQQHNDARSLFRSRMMLDEDRAVSSANLASIYRDAGMNDVSVREAARAVTYDYANPSAHLFLSDSYNELRDPTRFNLRYETVWFNELLLANLLSPVGGGRLSQQISQQEYSRLFEADGFGVANSTLYRSDNKSVTEYVSQFGTFGNFSYALDLDYQHNGGVRVNNGLDDAEWNVTIKQQVTPEDTITLFLSGEDYHSGDNFQYYNATNARPNFRFDEYQHPIALAGWHHEWSPGMHTLALGGRLENEQRFSDKAAPQLLLDQGAPESGQTTGPIIPPSHKTPFDVRYNGQLEIYTAELNQIFQWNRLTLSAGGRYQSGTFETRATMDNPVGPPILFRGTPTNTSATDDFERLTGYGYLTVEPVDHLWLIGGVAYDDTTYPRNFRAPPISRGEDHNSQVGPKAALVCQPVPEVTIRGIFTKSLGGVSLDESYRLEPTQLAGFPQAFRSLISESAVGSVAAPEYQTWGGALDLKFRSGTYVGLRYEYLETKVFQDIGFFLLPNGIPPYTTSATGENLHYRDNSITATVNQLLGEGVALGVSYKFNWVELQDTFPAIPTDVIPRQKSTADLHQLDGYILYNHSSGIFARAEAAWYHQGKAGLNESPAGDDFVQENVYLGKRFLNRRIELLAGILNLSDQDYHLNPLTVYSELPRKRSFVARLNFVF